MTLKLAIRDGSDRVLRDVAAQLLAQRQHGYPPAIAAGKLTQAEADTKLRIMRGVVAVWSAVVEHADLPPLSAWRASFDATADEMAAELQLAYAATRHASDAAPEDEPRRERAMAVSFLLFDHQVEAGAPRLCAIHADAQAARFPGRVREGA